MTLFDNLVDAALSHQPTLSNLRIVVEKELLHHDILRILSQHNLLKNLTFMGGTALRACYGGTRLSEDLDFTGGTDFTASSISHMSETLRYNLAEKYGLLVTISEPTKDTGNVDTWKIKIQTKPNQKHLPAQRINIDICALPSYDATPKLLINPYGVDMGTGSLIIQTQSLTEIYADKLLAFALRPNRLKYRDVWDIVWLHQKGLSPNYSLIPLKLRDRGISDFPDRFAQRVDSLSENAHWSGFQKEMTRFLPTPPRDQAFWPIATDLMKDIDRHMKNV